MVIKDDLEDLMCLNHVFYQSVMHFRKEAWIMIQDAMGTIICHFIKSKNKETCPSFLQGMSLFWLQNGLKKSLKQVKAITTVQCAKKMPFVT